MNTPRVTRSKTVKASRIDLMKIFSAMAYDLRLEKSSEYIDAYSLLSNRKYLSFISKLDEMTSQMYESVADERFRLHQLAALFSKYPFEDPSIDRDAVALRKFYKSEHRCRRMNQKFRARRSRSEPPHMNFMRRYIEKAIGNSVPYDEIFDNCDFGPGSSVGVHGQNVSFASKLDKLTVTPSAIPFARAALARNIHYMSSLTRGGVFCCDATCYSFASIDLDGSPTTLVTPIEFDVVQYNKITCVPKNAKTNRTIAIEPTMNGFLQKGADLYLRRSLLRLGVNLSDQRRNQELARIGSCDGSLATVDLSAASDSISVQLVKELLPPEWFSFLDAIRSPSYTVDGSTVSRYEKFCSMGNGFCFPLESLIFKAAVEYTMSVTHTYSRKTAVYGDDIILPRECALLLFEVLRDLGFSPNIDKTFVFGDFRESCGADYFLGVNVRPVYIKKELRSDYTCYPLLNELRKRQLSETWQRIYDQLPSRWRYTRPYDREDDSAITVPMDVFMSSKHAIWNRSTFSWNWRKIVQVAKTGLKPRSESELLAGKLRGDLKHSEVFASRFSESTRVQVGT